MQIIFQIIGCLYLAIEGTLEGLSLTLLSVFCSLVGLTLHYGYYKELRDFTGKERLKLKSLLSVLNVILLLIASGLPAILGVALFRANFVSSKDEFSSLMQFCAINLPGIIYGVISGIAIRFAKEL